MNKDVLLFTNGEGSIYYAPGEVEIYINGHGTSLTEIEFAQLAAEFLSLWTGDSLSVEINDDGNYLRIGGDGGSGCAAILFIGPANANIAITTDRNGAFIYARDRNGFTFTRDDKYLHFTYDEMEV